MTTMQWMSFLVVVLGVTLELTESKMMVRHFGPPPDMGPGPHGKYDSVIKVMQSIPNRCQNECSLSCKNGGILNNKTCLCTCASNWNGKSCTNCTLSCENGGTLDNGTCQCSCDPDWSGKNCSQCALSCENGELNETTCQCECRGGWIGSLCSDCELDCDSQHFLDDHECQCKCWRDLEGNNNCSDSDYQPVDCHAYHDAGNTVSGVYTIYPQSDMYPNGFKVFCRMGLGNGWIVIQRRIDGSENFNRSWTEYKDGFGSLSSEFWLGNEKLHQLTMGESEWAVNVALRNPQGNSVIKPFSIMSSSDNYTMSIGTISWHWFNSIGSQPLQSVNGTQFSTYDRDNDKDPNSNCAGLLQGGWWFNHCTGGNPPSDTRVESNLNGEYSHPVNYSSQDYRGIRWNTWDGHQIVKSEMEIIRCNYKGFYC